MFRKLFGISLMGFCLVSGIAFAQIAADQPTGSGVVTSAAQKAPEAQSGKAILDAAAQKPAEVSLEKVVVTSSAKPNDTATKVTNLPAAKSSFDWKTFFPDGLIDSAGKSVDLSVLDDKVVGLYFSAHWCPPCRAFSPKLVEFRNANQKDFEVVFISSDKTQEGQFEYMKELKMEWPSVKFRSNSANAIAEKYNVQAIPTLIILSPKGEIITEEGREQVTENPDSCIEQWKSKVK
ncbi:MAG: redoxin family protein [Candidatus Riflebacteria bacterium]|nr:redoxin family protein [Candidatus Riflebacteria bacterium]